MSDEEEAAFNVVYGLLHKEVVCDYEAECSLCQNDGEEGDRKQRVLSEVGGLAYVNCGEDYGKQVTIVDVVDST